METLSRFDTEERCDGVIPPVKVDKLREVQIRQAVRIIRQKHLVVAEVFFDRQQPLADVTRRAGVGERDLPIVDVAAQ